MKTLVIGSTGTVGSAVVSALAHRGVATVAASRNPSSHAFPAGVQSVAFDYADENTVRDALSDVKRLFVLAPPGLENQVEHWTRLFALAKSAGVTHTVLMTAKGAGEDTPHGQGEAALLASGLRWTVLQPTFFAQNFATYAAATIRNEDTFYYPAGEGKTAFVDARDIGEVAAAILTSPDAHHGKRYELTGPEALTMGEVAETLSAVLGRSIRYVDPGEDGYRQALEASGLPPALAAMFTYLYAVVVKNGWAAGTSDDVASVLGRPPRRFEAFARDYAATWSANGR